MKKMTMNQMEQVIRENMEEVRQTVLGKDKTCVNRIAKHMPELFKWLDRRTTGDKATVENAMKRSEIFKNRVKRVYAQM
jgi:hypothetical protein